MSDVNPEVDDKNKTPEPKGESVNERLLAESKAYKQKNKELQDRLDAIERKNLEDQGNYKSLLEKSQKETEELRNSLSATNQKTLKANINATVAKFAGDVVDFEDLMNQKKFKSILEAGIDPEELTVTEDAAEKYVKAVLEAKPHLKKATVIPGTHKGGKPGYAGKDAQASKPLSQMTKEEIEKDLLENYGKK